MWPWRNNDNDFSILWFLIAIGSVGLFFTVLFFKNSNLEETSKQCYYHFRDPSSQKTITCKRIVEKTDCGLFLKDCDSNVSGINCANNIVYYCR